MNSENERRELNNPNNSIMLRTGIFFHYQQGERLHDFPQALGELLSRSNVFLYDANYPSKPASAFDLRPVPIELLHRVHSRDMVAKVIGTADFAGALFSVSGTVAAATAIAGKEIENAFVFTGFGDHHAGTDFFGGGCYFNGTAVAIRNLQHRFNMRRFAIVDTDPHHGDGTWDIFQYDSNILYLCFCTGPAVEKNAKINIHVPALTNDASYLEAVEKMLPRLARFGPELVFWNWGYDGTRGEYGDLGLTPDLHVAAARLLKKASLETCAGRLIVVLCGGSRRDLATWIIPRIIDVLASE